MLLWCSFWVCLRVGRKTYIILPKAVGAGEGDRVVVEVRSRVELRLGELASVFLEEEFEG